MNTVCVWWKLTTEVIKHPSSKWVKYYILAFKIPIQLPKVYKALANKLQYAKHNVVGLNAFCSSGFYRFLWPCDWYFPTVIGLESPVAAWQSINFGSLPIRRKEPTSFFIRMKKRWCLKSGVSTICRQTAFPSSHCIACSVMPWVSLCA